MSSTALKYISCSTGRCSQSKTFSQMGSIPAWISRRQVTASSREGATRNASRSTLTWRSSMPGGAGVGEAGAGENAGAVHLPDHDFTARILPQDVGLAVVVVVAGPHDVPVRPRVADT